MSDIGNFNEAEISTRKAIELKPDFSDAYYNLGNILKDIGRFKDAELSYRKAIELKPDFVDAFYNLGNILKDIGKLKGAELSYRKAIAIKPNFSKAYFALSLIIINVKNDNLLRYLFSKEILESKENTAKLNQADIYFARGNILERKEDYKESYKMFRKANLITRKKFKSNFKIFIEVLEQDNFLTKEIEEIPKPEDKDRDLPTPIFTVGLPRAGKSTIESILSKNNSLRKFGESKGISAVVRDYKNIAESCQLLGISINSTFKEIRTVYLSLAKQYHPDKEGMKN